MKADFKVDGLRDLENILATLPKATAKPVIRRALTEKLKPVADMANALWPGADDTAFGVSTRLKNGRRAPETAAGAVTVYVGATQSAPHAHLREFGTEPRFHKSGKFVGAVSPQPVLAPAWEANKGAILSGLAAEIRSQLDALIARRASREA